MADQERGFPGRFLSLIAFTGITFFALFAAGCGGGGSSASSTNNSNASTSQSQSSSPTPGSLVLKADAGPVCETLLKGETYISTVLKLSCNNGPDSYTAYLNGSRSTAPNGQVLSYAWSFDSNWHMLTGQACMKSNRGNLHLYNTCYWCFT
jgi:hypothetical protein